MKINWAEIWLDHGQDPAECSMFDCNNFSIYFTAPSPCGPNCDHMHALAAPMCEFHSQGKEIVGTMD